MNIKENVLLQPSTENNRNTSKYTPRIKTLKESKYSSLPPYAVNQVNTIIKNNVKLTKNSYIIDATAHVGFDTINFVTSFGVKCFSVEVNKEAHELLCSNILELGLQDSVKTVHMNCLDFIDTVALCVDFIYFDPPWGGPDYWKQKKMMLYLEYGKNKKIPMYDVINNVFKKNIAKQVLFKTPSNFDMSIFSKKFKGTFTSHKVMKPIKKGKKYAHISYYLLVCY